MNIIKKLALVAGVSISLLPSASAVVIISFEETQFSGSNGVMMRFDGTFDTGGLTFIGSTFDVVGESSSFVQLALTSDYSSFLGGASLSYGFVTYASTRRLSGDSFGFFSGSLLAVSSTTVGDTVILDGASNYAFFAGETIDAARVDAMSLGSVAFTAPSDTIVFGLPVPEPSSAALLSLGGLALLRRRR